MTPSFCSNTDTKQSLQYTIKTDLSGRPRIKFEANMNYVPPSSPSTMKLCSKKSYCKISYGTTFDSTTPKQSCSDATPEVKKDTSATLTSRYSSVSKGS